MNTQPKHPPVSARDRITRVASDLFYRQGYRATGINEVISKSDVAKATFYSHFPTKETLALTCLQQRSAEVLAHIDAFVSAATTPRQRFLAVLRSIGPLLIETDFRGCVFINMASEVPDHASPLRKAGEHFYAETRARIERLGQALIDSDRKQYGHLNLDDLSDEYMLLFTGAIALAPIYHDIYPLEHAVQTLGNLIDRHTG